MDFVLLNADLSSLRVQVHRTLLSKDSSLFSSMFELPQGDQEVDGTSDSCPIYLNGESVAEFKNFLWVLYALYVF